MMKFEFRGKSFDCDRTRVVGILNITPDSFSDGGEHFNQDEALKHALRMLDEGADIIDIGGESSRPGSAPVSDEEEARRVLPLVAALRNSRPDAVISVDTTKNSVAEAALEAGADIINDISGLRNSQELGRICARFGAGIILMHMRGTPATMRSLCEYRDLISEVGEDLRRSIETALECGLKREAIVIDPGVGFAKNAQQSLEIIANWTRFLPLGRPLLIGHSRKSFIGEFTGARDPADRIPATCALSFQLALQSLHFLRVHDVRENVQVLKLARSMGGA